MKIKQMILAVFASLMVSESHACMVQIYPQEAPKSELHAQQVDRLLTGVNPPKSTEVDEDGCRKYDPSDIDRLPSKEMTYFMNRVPAEHLVAAVDFYLSHLGVKGADGNVLGFKHAGKEGGIYVLKALARLSPDDYQLYFDYALSVFGRSTWGHDIHMDSWGLAKAFEKVSLCSKESIGAPLGQLKELETYTRGDDSKVLGRLIQAQQSNRPGYFAFLKTVFESGAFQGVRAFKVADATYFYHSGNPTAGFDDVAKSAISNGIEEIDFQLSLE